MGNILFEEVRKGGKVMTFNHLLVSKKENKNWGQKIVYSSNIVSYNSPGTIYINTEKVISQRPFYGPL